MKSLKLRIAIGLVILALFFVGAWIINGYSRHASSTGPDGAYESIASEPISTIARPNEIIAASNTERGRAVGKSMPKLGTAEWTKWYQALSPVDRHSWAMAQDEQEKQPEMAKIEKGKIQIKKWTNSSSGLFKTTMVTNYKPLLEMQRKTGVRPFQIKTVRTENGLLSTLNARLAQQTVHIAWDNQKVTESAQVNEKGWESPIPQAIPEDMFLTSGGKEIAFKNKEKSFKAIWDSAPLGNLVFPLALDSEYRYAFGLVRREEGGKRVVDQVIAIDVVQKKVADVITIPAVEMGVNVIFNTETEFLLILDSKGEWMVMVDLKATR